jgi:hypothetical protein
MEFIELRRILQDTQVDHITEAGQLVIPVRDASKVWVNLVMPAISGMP